MANNLHGAGVLLRKLREGDGLRYPIEGDSCRIHYELCLEDGTMVDSTRQRNIPFEFTVGAQQVMDGLDEAIRRLSEGSLTELTIPSCFAYGAVGFPPRVPPHAVLVYRVEVLRVIPPST